MNKKNFFVISLLLLSVVLVFSQTVSDGSKNLIHYSINGADLTPQYQRNSGVWVDTGRYVLVSIGQLGNNPSWGGPRDIWTFELGDTSYTLNTINLGMDARDDQNYVRSLGEIGASTVRLVESSTYFQWNISFVVNGEQNRAYIRYSK